MTAAELVFSPELHEYRTPAGVVIPSVTQILAAVGVSVDFDALAGMSHRVGQAIDLKRDIGTALHQDAHAFDDNDLDWSTVDPRVEPYLQAWATFRENTGLAPLTRERLVYHPVHEYAGTLDGIFGAPNGQHVLVDLKTGDPDDSGCAYQTSAYLAAAQYGLDDPIVTERWGIQLTPERRVPYRICRYGGWQDFHMFQCFLTTYRHQATRRLARTA